MLRMLTSVERKRMERLDAAGHEYQTKMNIQQKLTCMFHIAILCLFHDSKQVWHHRSPAFVKGYVNVGHLSPKDHFHRRANHSNFIVVMGRAQNLG